MIRWTIAPRSPVPRSSGDYQHQWDFGDGSPTVTGQPEEGSTRVETTHAFSDHRPAAFTVVLTVSAMSDAGRVSGSDTVSVQGYRIGELLCRSLGRRQHGQDSSAGVVCCGMGNNHRNHLDRHLQPSYLGGRRDSLHSKPPTQAGFPLES